jgi:hypothetical protein
MRHGASAGETYRGGRSDAPASADGGSGKTPLDADDKGAAGFDDGPAHPSRTLVITADNGRKAVAHE